MQRILQHGRGGASSVACLASPFPPILAQVDFEEAKVNHPQTFKNLLIAQHSANFGLRTLVETGTYNGDTIAMQLPHFDHLYSIELDETLHAAARVRFAANPNVHLIKGDAALSLAELLPKLTAPALFWLDGHYSGAGTAYGLMDTPIIFELGALFAWPWVNQSVILIDDIRLFVGYENDCGGSPHCYPRIDDLRIATCVHHPDLNFDVFGGMAALYPTQRKTLVPPRTIPPHLAEEFALGGTIPMSLEYVQRLQPLVSPMSYLSLVTALKIGAPPFDTTYSAQVRSLLARHITNHLAKGHCRCCFLWLWRCSVRSACTLTGCQRFCRAALQQLRLFFFRRR